MEKGVPWYFEKIKYRSIRENKAARELGIFIARDFI